MAPRKKKKRGRPPVKDPMIQIGVKIPQTMAEELKEIAVENNWGMSQSALVRLAVARMITQHRNGDLEI